MSHSKLKMSEMTQKSPYHFTDRSSTKFNLDNYLNGTTNFEETKRFQEQAMKSGLSQLDTQKLLDLVQKYGDPKGSTMTTNQLLQSRQKGLSDMQNL